ncbi:Zinc finger domain protein 2B hWALp4 [Triplophysa tibetana]|uniref:Zinc finger domain protein 2B hWALp4 n=1 Tax=Triplophysa tibetana TaxID=1572043 RepID=A0A5A9P1H1_9TELE|nr:Zinc finger domain protein 2B hWALp4 [Triplophysa tibetana]
MESAERLEPSTAGQTPIRSKGKPRDSSPTTNDKKGHLFGMLGNHGLGVSSVSGVFPMMHHSSASLRSDFGGLGTLGMSVALSSRSQLGALPDWWRSADAQGQGSAVLFPHLLGLPALFSMPSLNQEQNLIQSRAPRLNGSVNGKGKSSPVSSAPCPVLTASDQTRISKPAINHLEDKTRLKTKGKLCRKLPVVSIKTDSQSPSNHINHDSQSASTSDSSSEALHSSDSDDLEDDDDDDDDDDQTDDSVESECAKDLRGMKKGEMQTDKKKNHHTPVSDTRDRLSFTSSHMASNPLLFQVFRPSDVPGKHTSVIQATGLPTSTNPLGLVTQPYKDRDVPLPKLLSHSSPKPVSVTPSPNPLSLSSSPKSSSLTPSPKSHSVSSSPVPASRSPSSRALSLQSDHIKSGRNNLDETLLNFSKLRQSFLPQEPMKQALSSALRGAQTKISSPSFSQTLESQNGQKSFFNHLFLPLLPMESHHSNGVQDAPLALITKPRSQNSLTPEKPLLAINSPVNLSTTGTWQTSTEPVERGRTFTSSALTSAASGGNGCKSGRGGVTRGRETPMGQFRGVESDLASSNDSEDSLIDDEDDASNDSLSDSDSNLDSDSDDEDDAKHEDVDSDMEVERMPLKPFSSSLDTSFGRTTSPVPLNLQVHKTPAVGVPTIVSTFREPTNHNSTFTSDGVATAPGKRRKATDETALRKPLEYGWQRETRITNTCGRLRGSVAYYAPCGRKIKHAKIKVGDFYEARDGPQGAQWYLLKEEEVDGRILAMEGRRGRPRNPKRSGVPAVSSSHSSMRVCGVDESKADGLSVSEVKLLRRLEAQEIARQAAQMKLIRKLEKQALARAAKEARRQQAIMQAEERKKQKEHMKVLKQQEKIKRIQQIRMEKEFRAQQILEAKRKRKEEAANARMLEAEKRMKEKELRRQQAVILKLQELERHRLDMVWERERHRQHVMLLKTMEARKKAEEKERVKQEKRDEKRINKQRRQELRRLELEMSRELNKPNEDMCLSDHEVNHITTAHSPALCIDDLKRHFTRKSLSRIPGLVLPGGCFADCLMVMQFLRCFGKVLGFDISAEVPSLAVLQAGLLNVGDHMTFIQDLLVRMLSAALSDPGLPTGYRVKTALGEHVTNVRLDRDNVSEVLQIYMEAQCGQTDLAPLAESLMTKAFQAHAPSQKASILAFLANELTCSKSVISEIDRNIDSMTSLRREKWLVEGNLRKLKRVHSKRTGKRESNGGLEERQTLNTPATGRKRKRKSGESEDDDEEEDEDSEEQGEDDEEDFGGKRGKKADACEEEEEGNQTSSIEDLEKQIEKLSKQQSQVRRKLFEVSHSLGSVMFGQDRYKRRYWVLPQCGGVFVEATERSEGPDGLQREMVRLKTASLIQVKEERLETPKESRLNAHPDVKHEPASLNEVDSLNLFLQKPGSFSKLGKLLEVAMMSDETKQTALPSSPAPVPSTYLRHANQQLHKVLTGRNSHWFSLLPRSPCDGLSLTDGPETLPHSTSSSPQTSSGWVPSPSATSPAVSAGPNSAAGISNFSLMPLGMKSCMSVMDLPFCSWSNGNISSSEVSMAPLLGGLYPPTEVSRDVNPFLNTRRRDYPTSPGENPLSTPSPAIEMSKHQDYPLPHPVPKEMLSGWWRVRDIDELRSIEKACHSRGIRERALQKQLQKHMDHIYQLCAKNRDVTVIESSELETHQISEDTVYSWCVDEQVMDVDIGVLQKVEELELRVTSANLQVKGWTPPAAQSHSEHLVYHEHKPVIENNQSDDRSDYGIVRHPNNPLDIAVMRLEQLERNIERRYLKSPLNSGVQIRTSHTGMVTAPPTAPSPTGDDEDGVEEDLSPALKQWRKALGEVRSSSQLSMCIQQLHKSIDWDKFIMKVYCQICNRGENEDLLLLCDGCDGSCHTYCHKPKITSIPSGDWFCPACVSRANSRSLKSRKPSNRSSEELKKLSEVKRDGKASATGETSEDESGRASSSPSKVSKETKKTEDPSTGPVECVKQVTTARDDSKDVTICRILLAELESHQDAWPFMRPVDRKSVPGYRKVIRKPMDFSTIREKLTNSQYLNLETFIIDVNLVFDNCERFNEDHSDIGRAGHTMRRFFHSRWTELLKQNLT